MDIEGLPPEFVNQLKKTTVRPEYRAAVNSMVNDLMSWGDFYILYDGGVDQDVIALLLGSLTQLKISWKPVASISDLGGAGPDDALLAIFDGENSAIGEAVKLAGINEMSVYVISKIGSDFTSLADEAIILGDENLRVELALIFAGILAKLIDVVDDNKVEMKRSHFLGH
ncbi:hypothetical protein [uncultured Methanobrevibacter sp.]|uniref:hypothetical protein n=1 Tax=uncultured Methanobrevibacter sp. TaxID=253161 RepID=UPI002620CB32|nr:hypothetical protein [uncultured Methanobrevibacter sp.]